MVRLTLVVALLLVGASERTLRRSPERWSAPSPIRKCFPIPGASVTITEVNTNIKSAAVSNENGNFVFSSLQERRISCRSRALRLQESRSRRHHRPGQHHDSRRSEPRGRHGGGNGQRGRRITASADRSHRHGPHHRERAARGSAARVEPQLSGRAHHGSRDDAAASRAFGVLQRAGQPVRSR